MTLFICNVVTFDNVEGMSIKKYFCEKQLLKPVFHGACFGAVSALSSPGKALPGEDKARTKSAPKPLQNTLHGKRAL